METAVTFATSDVDKLNSIKDFIKSLNVPNHSRRRDTSAY